MATLEELSPGTLVEGVVADGPIEVVSVKWFGQTAVELTYKVASTGSVSNRLLYRTDEDQLRIAEHHRPWAFDGDGEQFRLVAEAKRIRLAYLFDPRIAVHASQVEPLPHQLAAVYGEMLRRQPLRYLLADDPGAGKTIMAGLFIKELILRGDLERCLVICPANLAEQWQDELAEKFKLRFEIVGSSEIESAVTRNPFQEKPLVISRLDLLKRDQNLERLAQTDWDLVVLSPRHTHKRNSKESKALAEASRTLQNRGNSPRSYRNMLVFAAADEDAVSALVEETRRHLAWASVQKDAETLNLDRTQTRQVSEAVEKGDQNIQMKLDAAYQWALSPRQEGTDPLEWEAISLKSSDFGSTGGLVQRATYRLVSQELLILQWSPIHLRRELDQYLWKDGQPHVTVKQLWTYFATYLYLSQASGQGCALGDDQVGCCHP